MRRHHDVPSTATVHHQTPGGNRFQNKSCNTQLFLIVAVSFLACIPLYSTTEHLHSSTDIVAVTEVVVAETSASALQIPHINQTPQAVRLQRDNAWHMADIEFYASAMDQHGERSRDVVVEEKHMVTRSNNTNMLDEGEGTVGKADGIPNTTAVTVTAPVTPANATKDHTLSTTSSKVESSILHTQKVQSHPSKEETSGSLHNVGGEEDATNNNQPLPTLKDVPLESRPATSAHVTISSIKKDNANWSDFYHAATNPEPKYTKDLAKEAILPGSWQCSANNSDAIQYSNNRTMFAFVHIYKASGTTVRQFFHELAYACHKTWVSLTKCTGVLPSTIQSKANWKPCLIEEIADGQRQSKAHYMNPKNPNFVRSQSRAVNNPGMASNVDIYGGHARIGTGDYIFTSFPKVIRRGSVRYIVFLRDPIERLVSGVLYMNKVKKRKETLEQVVSKVKELVVHERSNDKYFIRSLDYLLTPAQRVANDYLDVDKLRRQVSNNATISSTSSFAAEARAKLAIQNLYKYNAIIGMTEDMTESLTILKHIFLNGPDHNLKDKAEQVFQKFSPKEEASSVSNNTDGNNSTSATSDTKGGFQANKSRGVSTTAVIAELEKDEEYMILLEEFVKYERMITDYAWTMHNLQHDAVVTGT